MSGALKVVGKAFNANPLNKALGLGTEDEQGAYATPEQKAAKAAQDYYANYGTNMDAATKGVQDGALTRGIYGEGGLQSQLSSEGRDLADNGFQLTQGDREAYGQASGDISRLFGQEEQQASQSLARRGLASSDSGAAGATFSGLAGNKNERLAKVQTDIAQKRMADTQQRIQANRSLQSGLATQGTALANSAFNQKGASLQQAAGNEDGINQQNRQTMTDQQAAVKPGLFSTIGQGLQAGIGNLATQAPGMLATGGMPMGGAASGGAAPTPQKKSMFG